MTGTRVPPPAQIASTVSSGLHTVFTGAAGSCGNDVVLGREDGEVPKRVLVVDDEPKIVEVVGDYLRSAGFSVTTAADGDGAIASARARPPDLVVLDLGLPGLDGLDVARELRRPRLCRSSC